MTFVLGISGGSGSGKTYLANELNKLLGADQCDVISQDNFYFDQSHRFDFDGGTVNFDHPDAIDFALLKEKLTDIKNGFETEIPIYDFKTHRRMAQTIRILPKNFLILDGILILNHAPLLEIFNETIFVETSEDLRFKRRLTRDVNERGRNPEGVRNQFIRQVKPMHDLFVEPSKAFASRILKESDDFSDQLNFFYRNLMDQYSAYVRPEQMPSIQL